MGDNPFNAMLDPGKQGTITGFIGGLMGNPTQEQAQGSATGRALQELSALREQGATPQQALLKWFQTPSGQDYFANAGPNGLKALTDGLTATQAPAPVMHNLPEGSQLYRQDSQGNLTLGANNPKQYPPTTLGPQDIAIDRSGNKIAENPNEKSSEEPADVRSFKFFTQLARLPKDEIQRLAALKADPTPNDPNSVKNIAIDKLIKDYQLDPRLGQALKADAISVIPLKNEFGQDTGAVTVYDKTNPSAGAQIINPGKSQPTTEGSPAAPLPGQTPGSGAATGVLPPAPVEPAVVPPAPAAKKQTSIPDQNPKYFGTKADMFLGSGAVSRALAGTSSVTEQLDPKLIIPEGAKAEDRKTMIETLRSDLAAMGQLGGGIGVNKGVLEGYLKLAPRGDVFDSPHQAIQKGIRLYEHIQQEVQAEEEKSHNPRLNIEERKASIARAEGWKRVLRDLPTYDELSAMEKSIREGTAGAPTASGGVKVLLDAAGKAITEGTKQVGEVRSATGAAASPDIASMSDIDLQALDPRTLKSKADLTAYTRRIEALQRRRVKGVR